jgi:anthranilate/para-aminobenzoate synthase component I
MPDGDFDLAVIIRTLYKSDKTVSYWAGGAIVWDSDPADEWAEASLKMQGMRYACGL